MSAAPRSKKTKRDMMSEGKSLVDFVFALPCDDVRTEVTGKDIIIGVYPGNIAVPSFPANMLLCIWFQFWPKGLGDTGVEVRLLGPNNAQLAHVSANLSVRKQQLGSFHTPQLPIQVQTPGELSVQVRTTDTEWTTIRALPIEALQPGALAAFGGLPAPDGAPGGK